MVLLVTMLATTITSLMTLLYRYSSDLICMPLCRHALLPSCFNLRCPHPLHTHIHLPPVPFIVTCIAQCHLALLFTFLLSTSIIYACDWDVGTFCQEHTEKEA